MFTQKISMDCTQEQYEKYLKDELFKMGYKEYSLSSWEKGTNQYITNSFGDENGFIGNINEYGIKDFDRTYLDSFNAPLFLALAAMREGKFLGYGQYVTRESDGALIRNKGLGKYFNSRGYHISTKEEIMTRFGNDSIFKQPENIVEDFYQVPFVNMLHFGIDIAAKGSFDKSVKVTIQRDEKGNLIVTEIYDLGPFSRDEENELRTYFSK